MGKPKSIEKQKMKEIEEKRMKYFKYILEAANDLLKFSIMSVLWTPDLCFGIDAEQISNLLKTKGESPLTDLALFEDVPLEELKPRVEQATDEMFERGILMRSEIDGEKLYQVDSSVRTTISYIGRAYLEMPPDHWFDGVNI